jgi:tight adherence protein B
MSGAALHLAWLALIAALATCAYGAWLTARGFAGGERSVTRRLARARPPAAAAEPAGAEPAGDPLFAYIDARLPWLAKRLAAANAPFTPSQVVLAEIALAIVLLLVLDLAQVPAIAALFASALVGGFVPLMVIGSLAERRRKRFVSQLPQAIELIARSLQAGHPVTAAIGVAAEQTPDPLGPELRVVIAEMNYGLDRDMALRNLARRFPVPELRMFAASLEITRETGGNIAEVLLGLADRLRQHAQLRRKVAALSAEGRLSFWVIAALPVLAGGAILVMRPEYYRAVASDPLFWPMMSVPPVLMLVGSLVIWRMIDIKV